jgi:hypothetical protein
LNPARALQQGRHVLGAEGGEEVIDAVAGPKRALPKRIRDRRVPRASLHDLRKTVGQSQHRYLTRYHVQPVPGEFPEGVEPKPQTRTGRAERLGRRASWC